ncbi:type II toxin-antitoxin system RelE/ParE family toxin [Xanthomonas campestris pv. campestris]|nr:type II toxin-antitoxin system RelE/ParE family toxin [Xanthomonas sp. LMG 8993]NHF66194.1 type II toxin-antitoxin system RelE/ParE family toxin [Xanthomonas hortorum]NMI53685.1 type II toxin-antitoxin system RelE/ParE family toxin [Xanthomonas hortorum pv. taraxaci]
MMHGYVLTDAAEADLRGIIRYTSARWGQAQVRRYIADLSRRDLDDVGCSSLQRRHIG